MELVWNDALRGEALRYLGCRGLSDDLCLLKELDETGMRLCRAVRPRSCQTIFPLRLDFSLGNTGVCLPGQAIRRHLAGCREVLLFCMTLGIESEQLLRQEGVRSASKAMFLDACCSAVVEHACDIWMEQERERQAKLGNCMTGRFSPGYGDFPLQFQKEFCTLLDVERRVGVCVNEGGLLIPRKTVTAVIGISDGLLGRGMGSGCKHCTHRGVCQFQKEVTADA